MGERHVPNKPLSYVAAKAVLQSISLKTREEINRRLPYLRVTDSLFPYEFENVQLSTHQFQIDDVKWFIIPKGMNKIQCDVIVSRNEQKAPKFHLTMSPDAAFRKLCEAYITNGTRIRSLFIDHIPTLMMAREPDELKLIVQKLELSINTISDYEHLSRFIDWGALKTVIYSMNFVNQPILEKTEIKVCKNLVIINKTRDVPITIEQLLGLQNLHLTLHDIRFSHLEDLVESWIRSDKPSGSKFTWGQMESTDCLEILNYYENSKGGTPWKVPRLGNSIHNHAVKMVMKDGRDLVMYYDEIPEAQLSTSPWIFIMEIMTATAWND